MSKEKFNNIELDEILIRLKESMNLSYDTEIANILGMGKGLFSTKKKSGSLFTDIAIYCVENKLDCNWILRGIKPKEIKRNYKFYEDFEIWLDTKSEIREHAEIWFNVDPEKNFREYLDWLKANEDAENWLDFGQAKVA